MISPPIIFLDIDGVLVIRRLLGRAVRPGAGRTHHRAVYTRAFSAEAITHLNDLAKQSMALIVVSSNWRRRGDVRPLLKCAGVAATFHGDWATDAHGPNRGAEIARWLGQHGKPHYCILDDWPSELGLHAGRVVRPDHRYGLSGIDVGNAIAVLQRGHAIA